MLPNLKPRDLLPSVQRLVEEFPDAELAKNEIGNLTVLDDGTYIGYLDLRYGTLTLFSEEDDN